MRPSIATAAALLSACLALAACDRSDKSQVHQAGTDLKSAGKATASAVKDLASAATHDLKSAGETVSNETHKATRTHQDKVPDKAASDHP